MRAIIILIFLLLGSYVKGQSNGNCTVVVPIELSKEKNDRINVEIDCPISKFKFQLLNRWGNIMYETEIYSAPLDFDIRARLKGKRKKLGPEKFNIGTYHWVVECTHGENGNLVKSTGNLTIID